MKGKVADKAGDDYRELEGYELPQSVVSVICHTCPTSRPSSGRF